MNHMFEDLEHIENLFSDILGVKPNIKDNIEGDEEMVFGLIIRHLENSKYDEDKVFEYGKIDLTQITDPLWAVLEAQFQLLYGEGGTDTIFWYLFDRMDKDGVINPLVGKDGKKYTLKEPKDLWNFIKYNYL
jgi:hypothetical protein